MTYDFDTEARIVCEAIGSKNGWMTVRTALTEAFNAAPRLTVVKLRNDELSPVAAPCAIEGACQYQMPLKWQSIATAPKDGTTILLAEIHHGSWCAIEHGSWGYIETSEWDGMKVYGWLSDSGRIDEPTHWMPAMPLPADVKCPDCTNGLQESTHLDDEQPMRLCATCGGDGLKHEIDTQQTKENE